MKYRELHLPPGWASRMATLPKATLSKATLPKATSRRIQQLNRQRVQTVTIDD
jgi:hypothetical protein